MTEKTREVCTSGTNSEQSGRKESQVKDDRKEDYSSEEFDSMKKKIREMNVRKKTSPAFPPEVGSGVLEKIGVFNNKANEVQCVIGSGYCAGHNVRLTRSVDVRRVSCVGEDGSVTWQMREVAILACPAVKHQVGTSSAEMAVLQQPEGGTTNGKRTKYSKIVRDQPLTDVKSIDEERRLPLDKTS